MKRILQLVLLAPLWLACKSSEPSEFGIEPNLTAYNDEAAITKKTYCMDAKCTEISAEDRYTYNSEGKLIRVDNIARSSVTTMDTFGYVEYFYNAAGLLARKVTYGKNQANAWILNNESEFEYENGVLKLEKFYSYLTSTGNKELVRLMSNDITNGKITGQRYTDASGKLTYRVEYGYKNGVINLETWYDANDKPNRTFEHKFAGNRRQIGEYLITSREVLAMIEKTYDEQGRLSTQETKVNNPLMCALPPGMIKYSY